MEPVLHVLKGLVAVTILVSATVFCCLAIYFFALIRLIAPIRRARSALTGTMDGVVTCWVAVNAWILRSLRLIEIETTIKGNLSDRSNWWIVTSNHQSWSDVILIQILLLKLAPPIKFFTKKELIWVPFVGFAMWLLRFPYVQRPVRSSGRGNSGTYETNKRNLSRASAQFLERPITVLSFLEGTRFTEKKHLKQESPFRHLLLPRTGGLLFTIDALNTKTSTIVDLTLNYTGAVPGFWDLLCGRCKKVNVLIQPIAVSDDFQSNPKEFVFDLWERKDERLEKLRSSK
ncbi:MAG: acetyltransferase [Gammaproteobacteria bacterium]|nr:acetyltransferase [Gammaproteobacteria bacterium]